MDAVFKAELDALATDNPNVQVPPATAWLEVAASGAVALRVELQGVHFGQEVEEVTGTATDGSQFVARCPIVEATQARIPDSAPQSTSLSITALEFKLSKEPAQPGNWTRKVLHLHGPNPLVRGRWAHGPFTFDLHPLSEVRHGVRPSRLVIQADATRDTQTDRDVQHATLDLLSVVNRTRTTVFLEQTYVGSDLVETIATPYPNEQHGTSLLLEPADVQGFMSACTPSYLQNESTYAFRTLMTYYCLSYTANLTEQNFIFASVFMESLKFHWALKVGKLPPDKKQNGVIRGFKKQTGSLYSFQDLMDMTAAHLGLNHTYTFIDDRNTLFHTGEASASQTGAQDYSQTTIAELRTLHDQMDEILMTLLGYQGQTTSHWNNYRASP